MTGLNAKWTMINNGVEQQYIELFRQTLPMINQHSFGVLNTCREEAMRTFERLGFPVHGSEHWAHTNLQEWFAQEYGLNINQVNIPINPYDVFHCDVPNLSTLLCFLLNDRFYCRQAVLEAFPKGVILCGLKEAAERHPELMQRYGTLAPYASDGVVAFNTAFVQDGLFLYIPDGVVIEKPIQLVNILRSDVDMMVNRRLMVIVGKQAEAKLLVCDHTIDNRSFLATQVTEIFAEEGAYFDFYELEENSLNTRRVASAYLSQERDSNVLINGITLHNGETRNNYIASLNGENAELSLSGMSISDLDQRTDNYTYIAHNVPRCRSNELFKYVLNDRSKGAFEGRIFVAKNAQKTEAYQTNRNLLATPDARMYTKPQLEIYADDVKCSHGATVGHLDEEALFYLRTRGISEKEARMLLMFAFTNDVIERIRLEPLRDRLKMLVEKRFRGELAKCPGCSVRKE